MDYFHGTTYWDPKFHKRSFVLLLQCLSKGLLSGSAKDFNLRLDKVHVTLAAEPGVDKKSKEQCKSSLVTSGSNKLHSFALLLLQGWKLQRKIRLIQEGTRSSDRFYVKHHEGCRSDATTLAHYQSLTDVSEGLEHARGTFANLANIKTQAVLGLVTTDADLPLVVSPAHAQRIIDEDNEFLQFSFSFQYAMVFLQIRKALWNQGG